MDYRITTDRRDFFYDTPYAFWYDNIKGTVYEGCVGPHRFCELLHEAKVIELIYVIEKRKENIRCIKKDVSRLQFVLSQVF